MAVAGLGPMGSTKQRLCQSLSHDGDGVTAWLGAAVPPLCPWLLGTPPPKLQQGLWVQAPGGSRPPFRAPPWGPVLLGAQGPVPSWVLAPARPSATDPLPHSAPLPVPRHSQGCAQPLARALHARLLLPEWALAVGVHRVPTGTAGPVSYSKPSTGMGRRAAAWASGGCHCCKAPRCWSWHPHCRQSWVSPVPEPHVPTLPGAGSLQGPRGCLDLQLPCPPFRPAPPRCPESEH